MRRITVICGTLTIFFAASGTATGDPIVESGGWANVDYTICLPGSPTEYQHTHAEAGFIVGPPGVTVDEDDNYTVPGYSEAYASTSHSWGESKADTGSDYLYAANYASADASVGDVSSSPMAWSGGVDA